MYKLKLRDWLKGLIIAVGTPVAYLLQELIPNWPLNAIEKAALSAGITYMIKNFFTDDVKVAKKVLGDAPYYSCASFSTFPDPGETGSLYLDRFTGSIYEFNGTAYIPFTGSRPSTPPTFLN